MDKFFDSENPLMKFLARLVDLAILNIMTLVFMIPIITLGGSLTAMNYVLLHLVRGDETYIIKMFRKSFKENFRQGIPEGLLVLIVAAVTALDMWLIHGSTSKAMTFMMIMITIIAVLMFVISIYMFALQSRYENTIGVTILNAVRLTIGNLPRSLGMIVCWLAWVFALVFIGKAASLAFLVFGLTLPGYLCAMLYDKVFKKIEENSDK